MFCRDCEFLFLFSFFFFPHVFFCSRIVVYFSDGGFSRNWTSSTLYMSEPKLAVGDVDGAFYDDILIVNGSSTVGIILSTGTGTLTAVSFDTSLSYSFSLVSFFRLSNDLLPVAVFATDNELIFVDNLYANYVDGNRPAVLSSTPTCTNASQLFVTTWKRQVSIVARCIDGLRSHVIGPLAFGGILINTTGFSALNRLCGGSFTAGTPSMGDFVVTSSPYVFTYHSEVNGDISSTQSSLIIPLNFCIAGSINTSSPTVTLFAVSGLFVNTYARTSGAFNPGASFSPVSQPSQIALFDLDQDGSLDMLVSSSAQNMFFSTAALNASSLRAQTVNGTNSVGVVAGNFSGQISLFV